MVLYLPARSGLFATKAGLSSSISINDDRKISPLTQDEFVISADEKTQIPIRTRCRPITPFSPRPPHTRRARVYSRHGVCAYDRRSSHVHRAQLFGEVVKKISIVAFDALVGPEIMTRWTLSLDKAACSGAWMAARSIEVSAPWTAFRDNSTTLTLVRLPTHASWLNQIEIYFSILQRKALTPADFSSQDAVAARILGFQEHYQRIAHPFEWKFTRRDLDRLLARWAASEPEELAVAA